jgi:uncharacterized protein (TIGR02996 family)
VGSTSFDLEQLFNAVFDAPQDDVRKLVLADALQGLGDPRGDFIALQLRGSAITRRRSDKLLVRHREAFLRGLRPAILSAADPLKPRTIDERWEKGFLVQCTARLPGVTAACRDWAMVHTLHLFEGPVSLGEVGSPHFTSLKRVFLYGSDLFAEQATALFPSSPRRTVQVVHRYRER